MGSFVHHPTESHFGLQWYRWEQSSKNTFSPGVLDFDQKCQSHCHVSVFLNMCICLFCQWLTRIICFWWFSGAFTKRLHHFRHLLHLFYENHTYYRMCFSYSQKWALFGWQLTRCYFFPQKADDKNNIKILLNHQIIVKWWRRAFITWCIK